MNEIRKHSTHLRKLSDTVVGCEDNEIYAFVCC